MGFMGSSNYCMAVQMHPPVCHAYSAQRPGAPLLTWNFLPWELLRQEVPLCPVLCHEKTDVFCPFDTFVERVRDNLHNEEIDWIAEKCPDVLADCGFFEEPPDRAFTVAWAMVLRVRAAQRMHDKVLHLGDLSLLLQRFIDTHLRLCALIYRFDLKTDSAVFAHPDYHKCSPLDLRGSYNGALPNVAHLLMRSNLFVDTRPNQRTPIGQLVHFLCKQWPHPCVSRGYCSIIKRAFGQNQPMMYLVLDIVLVYGILGNYVIHWNSNGVRGTPRRQTLFNRAAVTEHFLSIAWAGGNSVDRLMRRMKKFFTFASRLYVMDNLELMPHLYAILKRIYGIGDATREIDYVFSGFRSDLSDCDWRTLLRPGARGSATFNRALRAKAMVERIMSDNYEVMERAHRVILIYLFKLRKHTFSGIMAHTLTKILQTESKDRCPLLPASEIYDPETDPVLHPVLMRSIHAIARHIAPRNDGYFPIEWFQLLGVPAHAFDQLRDTYGGYESDLPDNPIHQRYVELFAVDVRSVVIMQRLFALVERFRGRRVIQTTWRTKKKQTAVLFTRYESIQPHLVTRFARRIGLCYYCECGTWLSPEAGSKTAPSTIHDLALRRGGYDPRTRAIYCGRSRKAECAMPAKKINMIGKMMYLNGAWFTLCTERGCGLLTRVEAHNMTTDGPVCGMHPHEYPRIPKEAHPSRAMLAKPAGNVFEARLKDQVATFNRHHGLPCAYCGVRPTHEGGDYVFVYDPDSPTPFQEVYLCRRHANVYSHCLAGLQEKSRMFTMIGDAMRKKVKI